MVSLEEKISRLSPELQREVEQFVDFLMQRGGGHHTPGSHELMFHDPSPSQQMKPVIMADEIRFHHDTNPALHHSDTGPAPETDLIDTPGTPAPRKSTSSKEPGGLLDWIE